MEMIPVFFVLLAVLFVGGAYAVEFINDIFARIQERWLDVEAKRANVQEAWAKAHEATENVMLVAPSNNGALPISRKLLESGQIVDAQLTLVAQDIDTRKPVQPQPNVPSSIHYAPHYARIIEAPDGNTTQTLDEPQAQVADFWSLYNAGQLPNKGFLMGYDLENGQPVTADWKQLYSALVGGMSGSGKSTLIRCVLAQSALQGGRFVVLDKHFGAGDESLGESLMPLRSRLVGDIAANDQQMIDAIKYMRTVGAQRLSGQDKDKSPLILVVDETTALLQRSDVAQQLTDLLGEIAQETRKVGVYALCIGQNFHGEIMKTTVRDSFVSYLSCRTKKSVARVMSGSNLFGTAAESLKVGQAVWMDKNGEMVRIAIPNTTQAHIEAVAHEIDGEASQVVGPRTEPRTPSRQPAQIAQVESVMDDEATDEESVSEPLVTDLVLDARKVDMVRRLIKAKASRNEILKDVWHVDSKMGGKKFSQAAHELDDIICALIQ